MYWPVFESKEDVERFLREKEIKPSLWERIGYYILKLSPFRPFINPAAGKGVYIRENSPIVLRMGFPRVAGHEVFHGVIKDRLEKRFGRLTVPTLQRIAREYGPIGFVEEGLADMAGGLSVERERPWVTEEELQKLEEVRRYYLKAVKRALEIMGNPEEMKRLSKIDPHDIFAVLALDIPSEELVPKSLKEKFLAQLGLFPRREIRELLGWRWRAMEALQPLSGTWFSEEFRRAVEESENMREMLTRIRTALENLPQHPWDYKEPPELPRWFKGRTEMWESKPGGEEV